MENKERNSFDTEKIKEHWAATSDDDFKTMNQLYSSQSYHWSLFLGHISVEKLLKALYSVSRLVSKYEYFTEPLNKEVLLNFVLS